MDSSGHDSTPSFDKEVMLLGKAAARSHFNPKVVAGGEKKIRRVNRTDQYWFKIRLITFGLDRTQHLVQGSGPQNPARCLKFPRKGLKWANRSSSLIGIVNIRTQLQKNQAHSLRVFKWIIKPSPTYGPGVKKWKHKDYGPWFPDYKQGQYGKFTPYYPLSPNLAGLSSIRDASGKDMLYEKIDQMHLAELEVKEEDKKSLDAFGLDMLRCNGIPRIKANPVNSGDGGMRIDDTVDMESDVRLGLFEMESLSENTDRCLTRQTSDGMSCLRPTSYEPSEVSINWSVVTASAANFSTLKLDYLQVMMAFKKRKLPLPRNGAGLHANRSKKERFDGGLPKGYFEEDEVRVYIVTCDLCPRLRTVIREIMSSLHHVYGVNALLAIEGGCKGCYENAHKLFALMPGRNLLTWNSIINRVALKGRPNEALALCRNMGLEGIEPDGSTMVSLLIASVEHGASALGRRRHVYMLKAGSGSYLCAGSALINIYAKHGGINDAYGSIFEMERRTIESWVSFSVGLSSGCGTKAIELFVELDREEVIPTKITFVWALYACNHCGLAESNGSSPCVGNPSNFLSAVFCSAHMLQTEHNSGSTERKIFLPLFEYEFLLRYFISGWLGGTQEMDPTSLTWIMAWNWVIAFSGIPSLYIGVFPMGLCLWVEIAAMRGVSATNTTIIYGMQPVWYLGFAWFFPSEKMEVRLEGWFAWQMIYVVEVSQKVFFHTCRFISTKNSRFLTFVKMIQDSKRNCKDPGSTDAFELAANFNYEIVIDLQAAKILVPKCAAEHLAMTEDLEEGAIVFRTKVSLSYVAWPSWRNSILVLTGREQLFLWVALAGLKTNFAHTLMLPSGADEDLLEEMTSMLLKPGFSTVTYWMLHLNLEDKVLLRDRHCYDPG